MSENPFKLIRSTDEPPPQLREEVVGSVKFVMLLMRFAQLFMADYAMTLFNNVRIISEDGERRPPKKP